MNIETVISDLSPILLETINPSDVVIINNLMDSLDSVFYKKECNINKTDEHEDYILYDYNRNCDDIITNIKCNYRFSIVLQTTTNMVNLPSIHPKLKNLLLFFPEFEYFFSQPREIIENSIIITLPILFMINTKIKFKIYINESMKSDIKITYNSYTLNNIKLNKLNSIYQNKKHISNDRGMIFEDGILKQDFDLD